jgi:type I restriction enzyme S subunit
MGGVRPGYTTTGISEIPVDWDVRSLGQLGQVVRGGSPRPAGDPRYFNGNFIPWLTVAALTTLPDSRMRVTEATGYLTREGSERSRILLPNTLIIANSGATLGVAKILEIKCCANDGIAALIDQHSGDKEFLCYYINTQTDRLREVVATGNGQPNLNTKLIRELQVPFPIEREQRAIAGVLSDVDGLIASLEALIAKKQAIKQGMMQQLLSGRTRLPGCRGDWSHAPLGSIATVNMGQSPAGSSYNSTGQGVPLVQGNADIRDRVTFDRIWTTRPTKLCNAGDVVLTVRAPVGYTAMASQDSCLGRGVCSVSANGDNRFLFHALIYAEPNWSIYEQGSTFTSVNSGEVRSFHIAWPNIEAERRAIAEALDDADREIASVTGLTG